MKKKKKKNLIKSRIKLQRKKKTTQYFSLKTTMLKRKRTHHDDGDGQRACHSEMQARIIHKAVSFEMTVESNYAIAIATLRDWLENPAPVFQPMRGKTNSTLYRRFFPRFEQVTGNCEEF